MGVLEALKFGKKTKVKRERRFRNPNPKIPGCSKSEKQGRCDRLKHDLSGERFYGEKNGGEF